MMRAVAALTTTLGIVAAAAICAEPPTSNPGEQSTSYWMKKKLEYSKEILAGLSEEDFAAIRKNANSMNALSQFEKWFRANTPEYRQQLQAFRSANK